MNSSVNQSCSARSVHSSNLPFDANFNQNLFPEEYSFFLFTSLAAQLRLMVIEGNELRISRKICY